MTDPTAIDRLRAGLTGQTYDEAFALTVEAILELDERITAGELVNTVCLNCGWINAGIPRRNQPPTCPRVTNEFADGRGAPLRRVCGGIMREMSDRANHPDATPRENRPDPGALQEQRPDHYLGDEMVETVCSDYFERRPHAAHWDCPGVPKG